MEFMQYVQGKMEAQNLFHQGYDAYIFNLGTLQYFKNLS